MRHDGFCLRRTPFITPIKRSTTPSLATFVTHTQPPPSNTVRIPVEQATSYVDEQELALGVMPRALGVCACLNELGRVRVTWFSHMFQSRPSRFSGLFLTASSAERTTAFPQVSQFRESSLGSIVIAVDRQAALLPSFSRCFVCCVDLLCMRGEIFSRT